MKTIRNIFLIATLLMLPLAAQAQFTYTTNDDGTLTVSGFDGNTLGVISIPATFNGRQVTVIGTNLFNETALITQVNVPEGVTTIDDFAFGSGENLETVNLPSTLTNIKNGAFWNCNVLTGVVL